MKLSKIFCFLSICAVSWANAQWLVTSPTSGQKRLMDSKEDAEIDAAKGYSVASMCDIQKSKGNCKINKIKKSDLMECSMKIQEKPRKSEGHWYIDFTIRCNDGYSRDLAFYDQDDYKISFSKYSLDGNFKGSIEIESPEIKLKSVTFDD